MALGLILRVSWICFLLFDGGAGSPASTRYDYSYVSDTQNLGDDGEDEALSYDEGNLEAPNYQPTGPVHTGSNKPTVSQQSAWAPSQQPSAPQAEGMVNGSPRGWGLQNLDGPIVFPFLSGPAKPQPGPVQPPTPVGVHMPATQSAADSTYAGSTSYYIPALSSQAAKSLNFGYGVADSIAAGANIHRLTYEDLFQYPSATERQGYGTVSNTAGGYDQANSMSKWSSTGFPSTLNYPSSSSYYPSSLGSFTNFGQTAYQLQNDDLFPVEPSSYIIQSRNAYKRDQHLHSHTQYTPEYPQPRAVSSMGAKGQQFSKDPSMYAASHFFKSLRKFPSLNDS